MSEDSKRKPFPPGTVISYKGTEAVVIIDYGGQNFEVMCQGINQKWNCENSRDEYAVVREVKGKPFYDTFDAYLKDFPEGQPYYAWATRNGGMECFLLKLVEGGSMHGGIPGNYTHISVSRYPDGDLLLAAHDCDDGLCLRRFSKDDERTMRAVIAELKELAPLSMYDLSDIFNFSWT
ncbi:hypothetical protein LC612_36185 [Nostoc sp. CHAB 5834]|nr:hypothetical protein [Nostoc sp. CHAB 5834]